MSGSCLALGWLKLCLSLTQALPLPAPGLASLSVLQEIGYPWCFHKRLPEKAPWSVATVMHKREYLMRIIQICRFHSLSTVPAQLLYLRLKQGPVSVP